MQPGTSIYINHNIYIYTEATKNEHNPWHWYIYQHELNGLFFWVNVVKYTSPIDHGILTNSWMVWKSRTLTEEHLVFPKKGSIPKNPVHTYTTFQALWLLLSQWCPTRTQITQQNFHTGQGGPPTSYKWSYGAPYKWPPFKWVSLVFVDPTYIEVISPHS